MAGQILEHALWTILDLRPSTGRPTDRPWMLDESQHEVVDNVAVVRVVVRPRRHHMDRHVIGEVQVGLDEAQYRVGGPGRVE